MAEKLVAIKGMNDILPGTGEAPAAPVFIDGAKAMTLRGESIAQEFHRIVEDYIERRFGAATAAH